MSKIRETHIPFIPNARINEDSIANELYREIEKCAERYGKDPHDFSARVELVPDPRGKDFGHFQMATVVYEHGELSPHSV